MPGMDLELLSGDMGYWDPRYARQPMHPAWGPRPYSYRPQYAAPYAAPAYAPYGAPYPHPHHHHHHHRDHRFAGDMGYNPQLAMMGSNPTWFNYLAGDDQG